MFGSASCRMLLKTARSKGILKTACRAFCARSGSLLSDRECKSTILGSEAAYFDSLLERYNDSVREDNVKEARVKSSLLNMMNSEEQKAARRMKAEQPLATLRQCAEAEAEAEAVSKTAAQPWIVTIRYSDKEGVLAYLPSLNKWLPFPLACLSPYCFGEDYMFVSQRFPSIFDFREDVDVLATDQPILASLDGIVCCVVDYDFTKLSKLNGLPQKCLLLFNPLTGEALKELLIEGTVPEHISMTRIQDKYFVCLIYNRNYTARVDIFDVKARSWRRFLPEQGYIEYGMHRLTDFVCPDDDIEGTQIEYASAEEHDLTDVHFAFFWVENVGAVEDPNSRLYSRRLREKGVLHGYNVESNLWMKVYLDAPRMLRADRHWNHTVWTWRDETQNGRSRLFLAASFKYNSKGEVDWRFPEFTKIKTGVGFQIWELIKGYRPESGYSWKLITTTPRKFLRHQRTQWPYADVFFSTCGSIVSMAAIDNASVGCPLLIYDLANDKWSSIPQPPEPLEYCSLNFVPLFMYQPNRKTFMS